MTENPPEWTRFTSTRTRVKAWGVDDAPPRHADGIAAEAHVDPSRTRQILTDLVEDGVLVRADRDGNVAFARNREHMQRRAEELARDEDTTLADLKDDREGLTEDLRNTEEPAHQRLIEFEATVVHCAIMRLCGDKGHTLS